MNDKYNYYEEGLSRLESFRTLEENWNGYNAESLSDRLINKAINIFKELKPTPMVFPTGRNSIQFEWEKEDLYLEMEIYEDKVEVFCCDKCAEIGGGL